VDQIRHKIISMNLLEIGIVLLWKERTLIT